MNIFNSLGSNYNFSFVLKSLLTFRGNPDLLKKTLEEKYNKKVILLYKGREAIELGLKSLSLPKGSFVAINGFTCFAVYEAIKNVGLEIEYLDIERGELNFSADELEKHINKNPKIKVVIIQNTLGYPADLEGIAKICKKNNLVLIEDLAHSIGTRYANGEEAGNFGDMTILSFSQDKMIDGISGGALLIKDNKTITEDLSPLPKLQQIIDKLYPYFTLKIRINYPFLFGKITHKVLKSLNLLSKPMVGSESGKIHKLPNWYTSLIKSQFDKLEENLNHRKTIAQIYLENLDPRVISKKIAEQILRSTNLRFPIFLENRSGLIKYLKSKGIYISDIWYDAPIAPKKYLSQTDYNNECPNSELASGVILNLPTHQKVSKQDAKIISYFINQWLSA